MPNHVLLNQLMEKFNFLNDMKGITEIMINRPNEIIVERNNKMEFHDVEFPYIHQLDLARTISGESRQTISEKQPLISTTLPTDIKNLSGGVRVQIVIPPISEPEKIIMSFRIPNQKKITYDDYKKQGAFNQINQVGDVAHQELSDYYNEKNYFEFIKAAVKHKLNIMNSGGTSTGKTTFTNALVDLIPKNERIGTLEDAREIILPHKNKYQLIASKGQQGTNKVTMRELLEVSLRLRPDRILQSEIRDESAYYYLKGINTGHPGSISTVHADSASGAITSINMLVMQANLGWSIKEIDHYVRSVLDVVIQWKKEGSQRYISEVLWLGANR